MLQKTEDLFTLKKLLQCAIVGDGMVGKTSLSRAFTSLPECEDYIPTVFENYAEKIQVNGDEYTISIFDSAGQREYGSLRRFSYEDSDVIIVCFSVVDRESFQSVRDFWVPEIEKYTNRKKPLVLVATQIDMRNTTSYDSDMPVSKKEAVLLANQIGASCCIECSSLDLYTVKKVFSEVVNAYIRKRKRKYTFIHKFFGK
ncbi:hypothetical protein ACF0H5_003032 [Mactra antiquata]